MTKKLVMTANYARTALLMGVLLALFGLVGHLLGGMQGMAFFIGIGLLMNFAMYWFSDRIALMSHHAQEVGPTEAPTLHRIVARAGRGSPAARLRHSLQFAQRLRHRPQPRARGGRGHGGADEHSERARAGRRGRP